MTYTIITTADEGLGSHCLLPARPDTSKSRRHYWSTKTKRAVIKSVMWPVPLQAVVQSAIVCSICKGKGDHTPKVSTTKGVKSHPYLLPSILMFLFLGQLPTCSSNPSTNRSIRNIKKLGSAMNQQMQDGHTENLDGRNHLGESGPHKKPAAP